MVASTRAYSMSGSSETASNNRCQTPAFTQSRKRVKMLFQWPNAGGRSRQGLPVRTTHKTASTNRRLFLPLRPGSPGLPRQRGCIFAHWASVKMKRSIRSLNHSQAWMEIPESQQALARVCRKSGRIALTTWLSDSNLFKMFMVMKPYMPPPPSPAPPSPFEWGRTERIEELLGKDFDLAFEKGVSFYREPSAEAAWETFSNGYGPTKALAASLDENRRAELRRDFIAFHEQFPTPLGICVPRDYWVAHGIRR